MNPINVLAIVILGFILFVALSELVRFFALLMGWIWLQLFNHGQEPDDKPPRFY